MPEWSRRVATYAVTVVAILATMVTVPVRPAAATPEEPRDAWVVGDSITYQSQAALRARLRLSVNGSITIAGVGGRHVSRLRDLVTAELRRPGTPDVMVLALGTNPDRDWRRSDLVKTVESIPADTEVVLVTVFRTRNSAGKLVARRLGDYSRWMRELAAARDNVCVADWRAKVSGDVGLLADGVHPTSQGQRVWSRIVGAAVDLCR